MAVSYCTQQPRVVNGKIDKSLLHDSAHTDNSSNTSIKPFGESARYISDDLNLHKKTPSNKSISSGNNAIWRLAIHELGNSLQAIAGHNANLRECANLDDLQDCSAIDQHIQAAGDMLHTCLQHNMPLSCASSGKISAIDITKAAIQSYAGREIDIHLQYDADFIIQLDQATAVRVMINIINNALESNPSQQDLAISIALNSSQQTIAIANNGCGIAQEQMPHIFKENVSFKSSSGLGLYFCKQTIENSGGDISVHSTDKETRFTLSFSEGNQQEQHND